MKLAPSFLLAIKSARGADAPAGCCQYLTIDANSGLGRIDDAIAWEYAGENRHGNPYYQAITACGEKPNTR